MVANAPNPRLQHTLESPGEFGFAMTPSDTVDIDHVTRGIETGDGGTFKVTFSGMDDGAFVTIVNVPAGATKAWRIKRLWIGSPANAIGLY